MATETTFDAATQDWIDGRIAMIRQQDGSPYLCAWLLADTVRHIRLVTLADGRVLTDAPLAAALAAVRGGFPDVTDAQLASARRPTAGWVKRG